MSFEDTRRDSARAQAQNQAWARYVDQLAAGSAVPFDRQWARFTEIFLDRLAADGAPPVWQPRSEQWENSNLARFIYDHGFETFAEAHRWSVDNRGPFWGDVIRRLGIEFARPPDRILDLDRGVKYPVWLPGARFNIVESCFGPDEAKPAVISRTEGSRAVTRTSYGELHRLVSRVAHAFRRRGLRAGDVVALYMPMTLECVATYLGIVRAGLCVASVADSFSASELAKRCQIVDAKYVVTVGSYQRGGRTIKLYETVKASGVGPAVVVSRDSSELMLRAADERFDDFLAETDTFVGDGASPETPITVLFSSGTTGRPKAIPWTHLTPIKSAMDGHFHQDIHTTDVVAWPTNIGWMMGPWLIFSSLINGATMALYEGAPNGPGFPQFVSDAHVTILGVIPSLVRAWRTAEAVGQNEWPRVRVFSSTGEASNQEDYLWLMSRAGYRAPVIEYLGGTEIGGGHLTGTVVQDASPTVFTTPALGMDVAVLDESGTPVADGETGELFVLPPSIGLSETLLNGDHERIYYANCPEGPDGQVLRRHGDEIRCLARGRFQAEGRVDDTMNLGGIKVSAAELERVIEHHASVYEAAAVAVPASGGGATRLVVFATLTAEHDVDSLRAELQSRLSQELNPLFRIADVMVVDALPRTPSNKIMRRELRARYATQS